MPNGLGELFFFLLSFPSDFSLFAQEGAGAHLTVLSAWRIGCSEKQRKQPGCVPEGGISPASIRFRSTLCGPLEAVTKGGYTPPRNPAAQGSGQLGGCAAECDRLCAKWLRGSGPLGLGQRRFECEGHCFYTYKGLLLGRETRLLLRVSSSRSRWDL